MFFGGIVCLYRDEILCFPVRLCVGEHMRCSLWLRQSAAALRRRFAFGEPCTATLAPTHYSVKKKYPEIKISRKSYPEKIR